MGSIWFFGFLSVIAYRIFNAGMSSQKLFYRAARRYEDQTGLVFDENLAFGYALKTFLVAITWFVSLPGIAVFKIGKRFAKD